jgi:hypothetical protein
MGANASNTSNPCVNQAKKEFEECKKSISGLSSNTFCVQKMAQHIRNCSSTNQDGGKSKKGSSKATKKTKTGSKAKKSKK